VEEKFITAVRLFDKANGNDPNTESYKGKDYPKELLYAMRMTDKLHQFEPNASEAVQLAVRCQHICRWEIPRDSYEMNRNGYLIWRRELKKFHAIKASEILYAVGYDEALINKVSFLLEKKQLKRNSDTQLLEDIICLVFLEFYFEKFSEKYSEQKLIDIVKKTWMKMSEKGRKSALNLNYSKKPKEIILKAISFV